MTNTKQTLTNRSGRKMKAVVTYHVLDHGAGRTVCGISMAELAAQDFRLNQGSACGAGSDVNCARCRA